MIPAQVLQDIVLQAQADYDAACGFLIGTRDRPLPESDPTAAGARELVVPLLQKVCDIYLSRLEQVEGIARGAEAQEREQRRNRYDDSYAQLHANGRCRSLFCCGAQDAS